MSGEYDEPLHSSLRAHHDADMRRVERDVLALAGRVTVLETRVAACDLVMSDLRGDIKQQHHTLRVMIETLGRELAEHMDREQRDRLSMLTGIVGTLLAALGAVALLLYSIFHDRLFGA